MKLDWEERAGTTNPTYLPAWLLVTGYVMRSSCVGAVCWFMASVFSLAAQPMTAENASEARTFVENDQIRVGVDLKWGGAITHVSALGGPNIINSADLGRQIQQSYYSGPANYQRQGREKSRNWASFPWNPIQTGDAFGNGSEVLEHRQTDNTLYVKTIPKLWPMDNDPAQCVMETWITLFADAPKFAYRARLTNARCDRSQYPGYHQEVPAVYVNGPWHKLLAYTGDKPFTGGALREVRNDHKEGWPWVNFLPTEGWAALVNEDGYGLGVCVPRPMEFHGGFAGERGQGDEKSFNTGYMAPVSTEILDHNIIYEYACIFVVGHVDLIRNEAKRLAPESLPSWTFDQGRHGWHCENGTDAGWPPGDGGLRLKAADPDRPIRLVGPLTFWQAAAAGTVEVNVSSPATGTITVFWRDMPPTEASASPSEWNTWRQTWCNPKRSTTVAIAPGAKQVLTVRLAGLPQYTGGITGLSLDVPDGVSIHNVRLVAEPMAK
mgnify:CR=1 FL=1